MRSLLFVPGDSARKFDRARQGPADALIFDLEDSVAPGSKDAARTATRDMLAAERRQHVFVRVNALDTGLTLGDLAAVMSARPDGIMLPKCESADALRLVSNWLDGLEAALHIPAGATGILPIATETAASVFALGSYGGVTPRLRGLMWGAEDLAASLGAAANGDEGGFHSPYRLARDRCLRGAAAAGVAAIDTVWTRIADLDGLAAESRTARRDGFAAKAVIHPSHVEPVNAAFTPTADEVAWAQRIADAFAANPGLGVVALDGRMIDKPHLRAAEKILRSANRGG